MCILCYKCLTIFYSTTEAAKKTSNGNLTATTTSTAASRGSSPVASLSTASPGRDVKCVNVVLKKATPSLRGSDQSTNDRWIDSIIDNNVLSLHDIAQFLLSAPHERSIMLMNAVDKLNKKSGELLLNLRRP